MPIGDSKEVGSKQNASYTEAPAQEQVPMTGSDHKASSAARSSGVFKFEGEEPEGSKKTKASRENIFSSGEETPKIPLDLTKGIKGIKGMRRKTTPKRSRRATSSSVSKKSNRSGDDPIANLRSTISTASKHVKDKAGFDKCMTRLTRRLERLVTDEWADWDSGEDESGNIVDSEDLNDSPKLEINQARLKEAIDLAENSKLLGTEGKGDSFFRGYALREITNIVETFR